MKVCAIQGCAGRARCKGYCNSHYARARRYGDPLGTPVKPGIRELFERKLYLAPSGCWEWTAGTDSRTGYGRFSVNQYPAWAHRVSYELYVGPIPDGLQIDHLCRNRRCVNPAHLEAVTQRVNMLRGMAPAAIVARTNRCKRDHELTPENTYLRPDGKGRQCRECIRIRSARQVTKGQAARWIEDPGTIGLDGVA